MDDADDDDENTHSNDDLSGDMLHVNYLTTCIEPFRTYIPSPENQYRIPFGNVRITFDGGGGMFNNITGGLYPGYDPDIEFTFQFDLQGLPSNCDGCRIQVNSGMTCDLPEIRFWDRSVEGAVNPWRPEWGAVYHSNQHGQARGYFSMFDGFRYDDHKSRTVVVFDRDKSTRIGCGVIRRSTFGECCNELDSGPSMYPSASPVDVTLPPEFMPTPSPVPLTAEPQPPPETHTACPTPEIHTAYPTPETHTECPTPPPTPQTPSPVATLPPLRTPSPTSPLIPDPSLPTPRPTEPPTPVIAPDTESPSTAPINQPEGKGVAPTADSGKGVPPSADSGGKGNDIPKGRNGGKGMGKGSSKGKKGGKKEKRRRHLLSAESQARRNSWSGV